jgi:hypothetical protein
MEGLVTAAILVAGGRLSFCGSWIGNTTRLCRRAAGRARGRGGFGRIGGRWGSGGLTAVAVVTVARKEGGVKGVVDIVKLALRGVLLGVMLGDEDQLTEIAEGGGATRGNLVGGKSFEDALEGSAHIEMGVRAKKFADIAFEVFFDLGAAESLHAAVGLAVAVHDGGHAALASISKEEVAEVKRRGLRAASHFLQYNLTFNILSSNYMGRVNPCRDRIRSRLPLQRQRE